MTMTATTPLETAIHARDLNGIVQALSRHTLTISLPGNETTLLLDEDVSVGISLLVHSGKGPLVQQGLDIARHIIYDGVSYDGLETSFADKRIIHPDRMCLIGNYVDDWIDFHPSEAVRIKELRRVTDVFFAETHYASVVRSAADKLQEIEQKKKAAHQHAANMAVFKTPTALRPRRNQTHRPCRDCPLLTAEQK